MNSAHPNPFVALKAGMVLALPGNDTFEPADHLWSLPEIDALTLAYAARRPLLVRGEPGSGKSQLARAAAAVLASGPPIVEVIHPRFEAMELLDRYDAVHRLADAQLRDEQDRSALDTSNQRYVSPGALWEAFERAQPGQPRPVLLIDEIDKADADVPNSLLDVLGNRSFQVPVLQPAKRVSVPEGGMPLIVITTNEERELPGAFVRRCVVLNVNPPDDDDGLAVWLLARAQSHRALRAVDAQVMKQAIAQVIADRHEAAKLGYPKVGLAETIDLLIALSELTAQLPAAARAAEQARWLDRLGAYALVKHAGQDQHRAPQPSRAIPDAN